MLLPRRLSGLFVLILIGTGLAAAQTTPYRLRSGDKLGVKFPYQPELNEPAVIVRPDGFINLPLLDEVRAKGLSVPELKARLEKAYGEILLRPVVNINLVEFVAPRIFVNGQVNKPGSYELRAGETLLQAVTLAGGFTKEAHRRMVLHARPVGKELQVTSVDVLRLFSKAGKASEVVLQDGDYIFVPESRLSKFAQVLAAFSSLMPGYGFRY